MNYQQHDQPGLGDVPRMQAGQGPNQFGQTGRPDEHRSQGWENASDREFRQGYRYQNAESPPRSQPYPHSTGWQQQYREGYGQQQPFGSDAQQPYAGQDEDARGGYSHHGMQNRQNPFSQAGNDSRSEIRNIGPGRMQTGYGAGSQQHGTVYGSPGRAPNRFNNGPKNYKRSDDRIMEDICETICQIQDLDCSDVEVEVNDCEVTIKGQVSERWMKHQLEDIADETRGVKGIENQIRVQRANSSQSQQREDEASNRAGGGSSSS
ncbi:MAG: BON domain-containing protein [Phycisphaerales bacterium]